MYARLVMREAARARWLVVMLGLAGCWQPRLRLDPPALPAARVGSPYRVVVTVHENRTPVGDVTATPLPPGLAIEHVKFEDAFTIVGVPTVAGDYPVKLDGWCYGTNFAGQQLHETLVLRVLPR
jgi:hypothetical protein